MAHIHFIRQKELNGLGDAIYHARFHCGNEPFAVLLGDTIIDSVIPATQQMIDTFEQYRQPIIAVETVPAEKVSRYGIVGGTMISKKLLQLNEMVEKPAVDKAPSTLAVAGRYILTPDIFPILEKTPRGRGNEIQLTDALRILLKHHGIMAQIIEGKRHDLGDKLEFLKTTIEFALKRDEFAKPLREFLKQIITGEIRPSLENLIKIL